jgi:hypothetical protein
MMDEIKSVKSLPFSGKKLEFLVLKSKFLACCTYQKCEEILIDPAVIAPYFSAHFDIKA